MTEEQNKQGRPSPATKSENKPASTRPPGVKNETPRDKKQQSVKKSPDQAGANTADAKKSVGQYIRDQRRLRIIAVISILALLAALFALSADYWLRLQGLRDDERHTQMQAQLQQRIEKLQQQQLQAERTVQDQRHQLQQYLSGQLNEQLAKLEKQQESVVEPDWLLAETEYLIRIADERLQLVGDVDAAISALMLADQRLFALRDPRVTTARRQLNNDINRLRSLPKIDTVGIALTLSTLQQQLDGLPLNRVTRDKVDSGNTKQADTNGRTGFFDSIIATLKSLVSIRRVDDKAVAIVPPEQRGFLLQNLALKLEAARFALLSGDDTLYHQSLGSVQVWLNEYFDQQASTVQAMQTSLKEVDKVKLDPQLPDLGGSLQAVQAVISQRRQTVQGQEVPSPDKDTPTGALTADKALSASKTSKVDDKSMDGQENTATQAPGVTGDQGSAQ